VCDYQGKEFGANYLDSVCIDGFLWDADSCDEPGGPLYSGGDIPCPQCNHEEWLSRFQGVVEAKGGRAALGGNGKEACPYPGEARFPQDGPKLREWWLKGWDEESAELKAGTDSNVPKM